MKPFNSKPRHCEVCQTLYTPQRMGQKVCGAACAVKNAKAHRKEIVLRARVERALIKKRKEAIKTIPDLIKEAQREFNAYIRARDRDQPCICCGLPLGTGEVGGAYDAGHYRSTGSASHLRFNEDNCHAQRKQCNRYGAGRVVDYRLGLISRLGVARVEALEASNTPKKWTHEELIAIRDEYRKKLKEVKA